jgi:hypothetical protein
MTDETYDDGLVHSHRWSYAQQPAPRSHRQVADPMRTPTPSTVAHDDHVFCGDLATAPSPLPA